MTDQELQQHFKNLEDRLSGYIQDIRKDIAQRSSTLEQQTGAAGFSIATLTNIQEQVVALFKGVDHMGSLSSKLLAQQGEFRHEWYRKITEIESRLQKLEAAV